ncbi:hypothetical protein ITI46_00505 [Streptomyces oryzae]|uniref:Secreted protein n=1 Tax=Streptomyces oryzae TaxID=1434886 RepID=A0ABS3X554_9ACTN|nr:hypothetical protein [Streptomyces oryzae]MBO8190206.1 hypothetical protein [Streptomyces oryzae]
MKLRRLIPAALAVPAIALALPAPAAHADAAARTRVKSGPVVVATIETSTLWWGEGAFHPNGDLLKVNDGTNRGGWRIHANVEKFYRGEWVYVFGCTAADGAGTNCWKNIPEGTLVRVHAYAFKGSETKYHRYSAQTRA